jgi:hypothetical protein
MIKHLIVLTIALSIYDTHDPKKVIVEGCREDSGKCVKVLIKRDRLEKRHDFDRLANLLKAQLK